MSRWKDICYTDAFEKFKGKTITEVIRDGNEQITFKCSDGWEFYTLHVQDCCECVVIDESKTSDFSDIIGHTVTSVDVISDSEEDGCGSRTITKYFINTDKSPGAYIITWDGESNGYYSESPEFYGKEPE